MSAIEIDPCTRLFYLLLSARPCAGSYLKGTQREINIPMIIERFSLFAQRPTTYEIRLETQSIEIRTAVGSGELCCYCEISRCIQYKKALGRSSQVCSF